MPSGLGGVHFLSVQDVSECFRQVDGFILVK